MQKYWTGEKHGRRLYSMCFSSMPSFLVALVSYITMHQLSTSMPKMGGLGYLKIFSLIC